MSLLEIDFMALMDVLLPLLEEEANYLGIATKFEQHGRQ
jgi:hypothetical protein